jgi:serine/threonine protein kinase
MITIGSVVAGYRIERVLGAGGMGTVYLARNPELPRRDALKVLSAELSHDPAFRARFIREADVAANLHHPNIVSIYSRGETDEGQLWIAMQFVDGTDADDALRAGTMTPARAVHIIGEVARAVDYAHRHNVVHRDIKPANFLLSSDNIIPERVLLGDFGIARSLDDFGLTVTGSIIATMAYAAPEVLAGLAFDRRADLYSLGCSLFRLLTGNTPFAAAAANGPAAVMMAHLHHPPPRVTDRVPGLPAALDAVIAIALAKNPAERFQSAGQFASAAAAALQDRPAPGALARALPPAEVNAYPGPAVSNWWQPPAGARTMHAASALPTQVRFPTGPRPYPPRAPARPRLRRRWFFGPLAAAVVLVTATGTALILTREQRHQTAAVPTMTTARTTTSAAPPPTPVVRMSALRDLLAPVDQINQVMAWVNPQIFSISTPWDLSDELVEQECVGAYEVGQQKVYDKYGYAGYELQQLVDNEVPPDMLVQSVIGFPRADQAQAAVSDQVHQWDQCANRAVTFHHHDVTTPMTFGATTTDPNGIHIISHQVGSPSQESCTHALTARNNVVVDVSACSTKPGNQAVEIADQIAARIHS